MAVVNRYDKEPYDKEPVDDPDQHLEIRAAPLPRR